jgi:hypothetical protein
MDDLISRQAAIDAINEIIRMEHSLRPKVYVAKDAIKKLPSVQPTFDARDTQYNLPIGTDLISRQAAIDAIGKVSDELYENIKKGATFPQWQWFDGMAQAQSILENLPSAQPEEASVILGVSKDGVRLWYKCSVCGEPANADDNYCCNCGRKFING